MANRFTRFVSNINRGVRNALNSAFGGTGRAPEPAPRRPTFYEPPPAPAPTPADYAEAYESQDFFAPEGEYYDEPYIPVEPVQPGPEDVSGAYEPNVTIYGDGEHFNEPFTQSFNDWMAEAVGLSSDETLELYGLSNADIIEALYDEGYDYDYITDEGHIISGLWHDFREEYEAAQG